MVELRLKTTTTTFYPVLVEDSNLKITTVRGEMKPAAEEWESLRKAS
jgi:hypothetical protein